jgi:hypothetical protein
MYLYTYKTMTSSEEVYTVDLNSSGPRPQANALWRKVKYYKTGLLRRTHAVCLFPLARGIAHHYIAQRGKTEHYREMRYVCKYICLSRTYQ